MPGTVNEFDGNSDMDVYGDKDSLKKFMTLLYAKGKKRLNAEEKDLIENELSSVEENNSEDSSAKVDYIREDIFFTEEELGTVKYDMKTDRARLGVLRRAKRKTPSNLKETAYLEKKIEKRQEAINKLSTKLKEHKALLKAALSDKKVSKSNSNYDSIWDSGKKLTPKETRQLNAKAKESVNSLGLKAKKKARGKTEEETYGMYNHKMDKPTLDKQQIKSIFAKHSGEEPYVLYGILKNTFGMSKNNGVSDTDALAFYAKKAGLI